jgi:hypothetical protein
MPAHQSDAKSVRALIKRHGLAGTSKLLELHHSSVTRIANGLPVLRTTARFARQRLQEIASELPDGARQ